MSAYFHPYHIVTPSPWPLITSIGTFGFAVGLIIFFNDYAYGVYVFSFSVLFLIGCMTIWWRDVVRESTFQGNYTTAVRTGLLLGFALFVVSEILFFFGFFWGFFHSSLGPAVEIGACWPPVGIQAISPFEVPLFNTALLLSSGATVTWSHHALINGNRKDAILGLIATIVLGTVFTFVQALEYWEASFSIADSVFGSVFFLLTGFHGLHVIIGTLFLMVCLVRMINHHFTINGHHGYFSAIAYYHFVDFVWVGLYIFIYWWGF